MDLVLPDFHSIFKNYNSKIRRKYHVTMDQQASHIPDDESETMVV